MQAFSSGARMFFAKGCYFFSPQSSSVINQRWRLQKYEHKQAPFARPKYVCTGCLWTKSYYVTIQMKPPQQNLHMVLYIFSMLTLVSSDSGTLKWNIVAHVQIPLTHSPIVWMRLLEVSARKQSFHIPTPHPEPNCEFSWARGKER